MGRQEKRGKEEGEEGYLSWRTNDCLWIEVGIFCLGNAVHPRSLGLMLVHSPNQRNFALEQAAVFTSPAATLQPTQLIFM